MEKPRDTDFLKSFLARQDHPCPRCGYNLRAIQGKTCPECGEMLQLRVGLVHPKLAALITGLIGLSAGLGLNFLLLMWRRIHKLPANGRWALAGVCWVVTLVNIVLFSVIIR